MAKQCPNCRKIIQSVAAPACDSCGFSFLGGVGRRTSFPALCMRIGASVFLLAIAAVVIDRIL